MTSDARVFNMLTPAMLEVTEIPIEYVGLFLLIVSRIIIVLVIDSCRK